MRLQSEWADAHTHVIRVVGDLEWADAATFATSATQTEQSPRRRIVDLRNTTFMDSAGLSALLSVADITRAAGGETVLVIDEDSYVRRLLEIRGVLHQFRITATHTEALAL